MKKIILLAVLVLSSTQAFSQCACCAGAGVGSSNGDYNNGILTLPKKIWVAELYGDYRTIRNGNAPEDDEKLLKSMYITSLGLRYGITGKFTVSTFLPYVFLHTGSGNDQGLGDIILLGTYNFYSKNKFNLAVQAGLELPTGVQKSSNFDNTTVIVGSGSYDPMIGLAFSKKMNKLMLQGNGLYKRTTNGFQGNYYGSLSTQNLSLTFELKENAVFCTSNKVSGFNAAYLGLRVFAGYYGEWLDKIREDGVVDPNSGHYLGFANLGVNTSYKRWAFPLTLSLPVINNMYGTQNPAGFRLRLGIIRSI